MAGRTAHCSHIVPCAGAGSTFPSKVRGDAKYFHPLSLPDNGNRPGLLTEAEGASSLARSIMHPKDGFRVINGQWLEPPMQPREALIVPKSPRGTPTG